MTYSNPARFFHWLIAGLIIVQYTIIELAENAEDSGEVVVELGLLANHKSIGILVLGLAVLRLAWRSFTRYPQPIETMPAWQKLASNTAHWLLYFFIFSLPISGWLMSSANDYSVSFFNLFALPDFIGPSESFADLFHEVHEILADALVVVAVVHVLAAFKHLLIDRDGSMQRMLGWGGGLLFLVTVIFSVFQWGQIQTIDNSQENTASFDSVTKINPNQKSATSNLPSWRIDYTQSEIQFSGTQAGAPFEGIWKVWNADIHFDESNLRESLFHVDIDIASVDSGDEERDETIVGSEFFNQNQFSHARFVAQNFRSTSEGYQAQAQLTMKGATHLVDFDFSIQKHGGKQQLIGTATLDRFLWDIGTGDWRDPSWVGQYVEVKVQVSE